jgi:hypothetical protein
MFPTLPILQYLAEHYLDNYDWFYVVPDRTYVRGEKLFDLVSHISISQVSSMIRRTISRNNITN